jgi:hypothetical protein
MPDDLADLINQVNVAEVGVDQRVEQRRLCPAGVKGSRQTQNLPPLSLEANLSAGRADAKIGYRP